MKKVQPHFFESPAVSSPVTFGLISPTILLPRRFDDLTIPEQEAVLCHELLHIERRDWLSLLFEELVRALFWFHPFIWVLLSRVALSREQVIDREVVSFTQQRKVYLQALLKIASSTTASSRVLGATLIHKNDLERRVQSLLQETPMSKNHLRTALIAMVAALALSVAVAGFAFPLSSADPTSSGLSEPLAESDSTHRAVSFGAESPLQVNGDVQAPRKIYSPAPEYTALARDARIQGVAILQVVIDTEGAVTQVVVLKGLPMGLSESAVDAVREWKFSPATLHGEPVAVYYNLTVNFRLKADSNEPVTTRLPTSPISAVAGDIEPPVLQYSTKAPYTERAREAAIEGTVLLELTIDASGVVQDARVLQGLPLGLSESAAAAAFDWKFLPATLNGAPVQVTYSLSVDFEL